MSIFIGPDVPRSNLVLHLDAANTKSYPGSGTNWTNLGSVGGSFPLSGSPTFSNGTFVLDGVDDYVNLGSLPPSTYINNTPGSDFSIFVTIKVISLSGYVALVSGRVGDQMSFGLASDRRVFVKMDDASTHFSASGSALQLDTWYSVGYTFVADTTNSYSRIYINGVFSSMLSGAWDGTGVSSANNLWFGWQSRTDSGFNPSYFNGAVSTIQLYSKALTDEEVLSNFVAGRGRLGV